MLKEDYVNKEAKTKHYAYIYYKDGEPLCTIVDHGARYKWYKLVNYNRPDKDELTRNIKNDLGVHINNYRKLKNTVGKINDFDYSHNQLTSLENAPEIVNGDFICSYNDLSSLEGAPKVVKGHFNCSINNLTSLKGGPKKVEGNFNCRYNDLTSLEGAPNVIKGGFTCAHNGLTSLKGAPKVINGNFNCSGNKRISKEELLHYLETAQIGGAVITDFGNFMNQEEAIEKLSGQIKESYFRY